MPAVVSGITRVINSISAVVSDAEAFIGTEVFKNQNIRL
jgi:hypothetical protein